MTWPPPAKLLRHREPALLIGAITSFAGDAVTCSSNGARAWTWPEMLEGAAQTAGLLAGLQPGGLSNTAVVAEYRDVTVRAGAYAGALSFQARLDRRILQFWRCAVETRAADGEVLLAGTVTLAPGAPE